MPGRHRLRGRRRVIDLQESRMFSSDDEDESEELRQATTDEEEGDASSTPSVMDQMRRMQKNMRQMLLKAEGEEGARKMKSYCLESRLAGMQTQINSLLDEKSKLKNKVTVLELSKTKQIQNLQAILYSSAYPLRDSSPMISLPCKTHGRVLIINNTLFTTPEMKERTGAEGDPEKLSEAFQSLPLGIEVKTHQNLDLPTMLTVLQDEASRDHSREHFFVCCIMSHGTQGKVCATNGFGVDILDILSLFNGKRCPSLMGKPKLFFIQACQGDKDQPTERAGAVSDAKPSPSPILAYLSTEADFFLALATVPGYVAYRGEDGADFVNVLARVLKEHGKSQDLMSMMATVSRELNEKYKYSPFCCTTLRHKMFFHHKPDAYIRLSCG
ncbi:CASP9 [Branchiostoma lanceolatum]|nr:CASP9 [Branchiostoma lanceolatum]